MGAGMFTAPERVVRDGYLVCFEGERMTMAEADRRGLLEAEPTAGEAAQEPPQEAAGPAPGVEDRAAGEAAQEPPQEAAGPAPGVEDRAAELAATMKAVELRAMAYDMGVDVPNGASKPVIAQAIAAAEAAGA